MDFWATILIAIISSGVINTIINRIFVNRDKKNESTNGVNQSLRLLMKDRLRFLCMQYIDQGWIYEDELEDLIAMHKCYHNALSGNGFLDELMNRVKKLEIKGIGVR